MDEDFQGFDCIRLSNDQLSLWITKSVGLRVIGLALHERANLLAFTPEARIAVPSGDDYQLRGGHRLWYGPEKPRSTYIPDDQPVECKLGEGAIIQIQPVDGPTGIQKSWEITLASEGARVSIKHRLSNLGESTVLLTPWAITMLRPGGVGIFPQQSTTDDENGLFPNRNLVLWPYTPVESPYIHWRDEVIFIEAQMKSEALKIGFPNPDGWMAYSVDGLLFVKRAAFDQAGHYLDRGASSEVYCCPDYIELETLGPAVSLAPGDSVKHEELWEIFAEGNWAEDILKLHKQFLSSGR